jgi:hypothetical protein
MPYIGREPNFQNFFRDVFNGGGASHALTYTPGTADALLVFVDGVYQRPTTDYTVSGSTLTPVSAFPSGTGNVVVVYLGVRGDVATPANGTITGAMLSSGNMTSAQLAAALSDETGTGSAVFSASPTFTGTLTAAAITGTGLLDLSGASAGQIKFPASQNASANANTLDDYEEGTWTPTDGSGAGLSFTNNYGWYTKVGQLVTAAFNLAYPANANGSNSTINGLPFTVAAGTSNENRQGFCTGVAMSVAAPAGFISGSGSANFIVFNPQTFGSYTNATLATATCIGALVYKI